MSDVLFDKKDVMTIVGTVVFFALFVLMVNGINTGSFVNLQNQLMGDILSRTAGLGTADAISFVLGSFVQVFIGLVFLTIAYSFLSTYGAVGGDKKIGALIGLINGIIMLVVFNFTIIALMLFIASIIIGWFTVPLASTYFQELKKWKFFRTGSHTVSRSLFIFNIFLAIGIFLSISLSMAAYTEQFKQGFNEIVESSITDDATIMKAIEKEYGHLSDEQKQEIFNELKARSSQTVDDTISDSNLVKAYVTWLPVIVAASTWFILEFLRSILLTNLAGLLSAVLFRVYGAKSEVSLKG